MMFEIVVLLEVIAFIFLALGIIPSSGDKVTGKVPLLNKLIFIFVATIIFFILGITSASYEYTYCYINQTTSYFSINSTVSVATCSYYAIENLGLSYFNMFMGIVAIVLAIVIILFALASQHEDRSEDESGLL